MEVSRRVFVKTAALAAGKQLMGRAEGNLAAAKGDFTWAALLHMGVNMWCDKVPPRWWGVYGESENLHLLGPADHGRFDEGTWRILTDRMAKVGMNMVVIDLGEAIQYPSHRELWVKGSWEVDRFRRELARLRGLGVEPIPKMNFSAGHDTWLRDYGRMVSTKTYYSVCADLIRDVAEIFDHPRYLHLGYDEETADQQTFNLHCTVRQGELWWHDFNFFVRETERNGMRPWIWSDYSWNHMDEFLKRMPRSVLQSNWYYESEFDVEKIRKAGRCENCVAAYEKLDKAGFDQIPTGSSWSCDDNFAKTVNHCRRVCAPERLKGFMMASWVFTLPQFVQRNITSIDQVAAVMH